MITATYNSQRFISSSLTSLASQSFNQFESVIIDGASEDQTLSEIASHELSVDILISERDSGIYDALNKGVLNSSGDVVGFLHSDDIYANDTVLEKVHRIFEEDPSLDVVYGNLEYVDKNDTSKVVRFWRAGNFHPHKVFFGWMPPHPTVFMRRRVFDSVGLFSTEFRISSDYLMLLRVFLKRGLKHHYLDETVVKMRVGGASNSSLKHVFVKSYEDFQALRLVGFGLAAALTILVFKNISKLPQFILRN